MDRDMNDKQTKHIHNVHNSSSSSSDSSSATEDASTTSSDSSSNGERTIIEETIITLSPHQDLPKRNKMDTDSSGASHSSGRTITSTESVRRYKNYPFGLNHHYLTMPDPIERAGGADLNLKETAQPHRSRRGKRDWKKRQKETVTKVKDAPPDPYRDLSILAPVSAASHSPMSSPSWPRHYETDRGGGGGGGSGNLTKSRNLDGNNQSNQSNVIMPAFDAGLDAKKCNSKAASDDYFCNLHDHTTTTTQSSSVNKESDKQSTYQDYDRLLVRFSSIMYATFLVILGCILHCSELRQKSKNSSDHIYTIIVALIGIGWLMFLQGDLQRYKRYASKYILIESIFNDHKQKMREMSQTGATESAATRSTSSSSASLVNDRMSMNTEVIFKKTAYKMYQRRAAALNGQLHPSGSVGKFTPSSYMQDLPFHKSASSRYSATTNNMKEDKEESLESEEHLVPAYKFLHGKMGANFYLKCGMAAFCFGHVIHEGLRFGQQLYFFGTGNVHCRDLAALFAHLITPLYSFYQLFMMFKYSNVSNCSLALDCSP